jgi:hypothetical protein
MNLEQFIAESLVQIAHGIEQANKNLGGSSAKVNPKGIATGGTDTERIYGYLAEDAPDDFRKIVESIDFDVAVYATEGTETKGGIGIMVGTIGLGSQGKSEAGHSSESRIKFRVPMLLPRAP